MSQYIQIGSDGELKKSFITGDTPSVGDTLVVVDREDREDRKVFTYEVKAIKRGYKLERDLGGRVLHFKSDNPMSGPSTVIVLEEISCQSLALRDTRKKAVSFLQPSTNPSK